MSKLTDAALWSDTLNQLALLTPAPGTLINKRNADRIREISCDALSLLLDDPEFPGDLEKAIAQAKTTHGIDGAEMPNFEDFLNKFMRLESKLLADAGVNTVASRDLEREIRTIATVPYIEHLGQLREKITFVKRLACDPNAVDDPKRPLWRAVWRGIKGVGLIGLDAGSTGGAAVILGPAGAGVVGTVVGISVGLGTTLVHEAVKGRW